MDAHEPASRLEVDAEDPSAFKTHSEVLGEVVLDTLSHVLLVDGHGSPPVFTATTGTLPQHC
jgi:hypothetical protein